jgi:hypothetical protein
LKFDERPIHYRSERKIDAEKSREFYMKLGAKVSKVMLDDGNNRIPNPKRSDGRYYMIVVYHKKGGYNMAEKGMHRMVTKPKEIIVGERGPERVDITPVKKYSHHYLNDLKLPTIKFPKIV